MTRDDYKEYLKNYKRCPFCDPDKKHLDIKESKFWKIRENEFPYKTFRGKEVAKHYLLVPKRHLEKMKHIAFLETDDLIRSWLQNENMKEFYILINSCSNQSVKHQHIHLILTDR